MLRTISPSLRLEMRQWNAIMVCTNEGRGQTKPCRLSEGAIAGLWLSALPQKHEDNYSQTLTHLHNFFNDLPCFHQVKLSTNRIYVHIIGLRHTTTGTYNGMMLSSSMLSSVTRAIDNRLKS